MTEVFNGERVNGVIGDSCVLLGAWPLLCGAGGSVVKPPPTEIVLCTYGLNVMIIIDHS